MLENVKYEMVGHFSSRGEWTHPTRTISSCEYVLMTEGKMFIEENGQRYKISKGELFRIDPDTEHGGYAKSPGDVSFFWLHFTGADTSRLPKHVRPDCAPRLTVLLRQLLHYANSPDYPRESADLVTRLILCELEVEFTKRESPTTSLYGQICEWCRINSDRRLTAAEVADRFGYNKDHLNRMFVKYGGTGLKEYINDRRTERIRALLLSDLSLKEIAESTGFEDYKDFLKFFRYHEGLTPTEFRNLYYNTHTNNH